MTLGIPSFDSLSHAAGSAPDGYALYEKRKAREYIRTRNDFIDFVQRTAARTDLTADMKITMIKMHTGMMIR